MQPSKLNTNISYWDYLRYRDAGKGVLRVVDEININAATGFALDVGVLREEVSRAVPVNIIICSPGGEVYAALAIYDVIRELVSDNYNVRTTAIGIAASAASMIILQAGTKRVAYTNTQLCFHEPSRWTPGDSSEKLTKIYDDYQHLERLKNVVFKILSERSGMPLDAVSQLIERKEVWLSAQEAKDFGFIDEIV